MAITLSHLCKYATENYGMRLICGEENMNNLVNWVHMLEDPETSRFLHGQELIFSTGIGHDNTDWFLEFTKGLVEYQASGLVLNIGPYIKKVPDELINYCKEVKFPLFTIPWKTRIVDITNDFCRKIIKAEENEITVAGAFRDAIFFPDKVSQYQPVLERKEFDILEDYSIVALTIDGAKEKFPEFDKKLRLQLTKILLEYSDRFNIFRQDKYFIIVLQNFPMDIVEGAVGRLTEIQRLKDKTYRIKVGIGSIGKGVSSLARSYKRATAVLQLAEKQDKTYMAYDDIGFYQLLMEVEDTNVLKKFYRDVLGSLVDYDEKHQTDYMVTLNSYLNNNCSVQEVARETYVHRNTVNYKIKKVKEILKCDLTYQDGLKLILAFHIKELL